MPDTVQRGIFTSPVWLQTSCSLDLLFIYTSNLYPSFQLYSGSFVECCYVHLRARWKIVHHFLPSTDFEHLTKFNLILSKPCQSGIFDMESYIEEVSQHLNGTMFDLTSVQNSNGTEMQATFRKQSALSFFSYTKWLLKDPLFLI